MKRLLYIFWAIKIALPYTGLCQEAKLFVKLGHTGAINSIAFSPDGQFLISGSEDNTIRLWDLKSGEWKRIFKGHGEAVSSVLFSADGKTIFSGSHDRTAKLWNLENGELIRTYEGHKGRILDIAIKDSLLITASDDQTAKVWSITSGKRIASISHIGLVYCVVVAQII
jgi:WD40 repeat protein